MKDASGAYIPAILFLALGLFLFFAGISAKVVFARHSEIAFAWLCIAVSVTFFIFSFFPATVTTGSALGFTIGGAGAFVVLVWLAAFHVQKKVVELEAKVATQRERAVIPPEIDRVPETIHVARQYRYRLKGYSRKSIVIFAGDLRNLRNVDVWVNSENTDMEMSRMHEKSISGLIRYEGSRQSESDGKRIDIIAGELRDKTKEITPVEPATVVFTGSGALKAKNGVHFIIHVASVRGEPASGYRQLSSLGRCTENALRMCESLPLEPPVSSIAFPLLGAGAGRGERIYTARSMVSAAVDFFKSNRHSCIRSIYFIARTDVTLAAIRMAVGEIDGLVAEDEGKAV